MKRNIYLDTVDIEDAQALYRQRFGRDYGRRNESLPVIEALGRVTAEPVIAKISNPHYNASAMDGISVKAEKTFGAHERHPVTLVKGDDFKFVDTGDPIEDRFDAVIMIEDILIQEDGNVVIMKSSYPWEHIRVVGEDIAVGDMIVPSGHKITPVDIGAILSAGVTEIHVRKRMRVGLIPTGTEIVSPGSQLSVGSIIDSNSRVFEAMVTEAGGTACRYEPVIDNPDLIRAAILKAVDENDMVIVNAGSSAGSEDYTSSLIRELGEVHVHGIAIKPGKPTILGSIENKPVIGIPGYPVSAFLSFRAFVVPLIEGVEHDHSIQTAEAILSKRVVSALKHKEYVRMKLGYVEDRLIATPLSRGAGATMSLVKADGVLTVDKHVEGIEAGSRVTVELMRPIHEIRRCVVSIGSHDIIMDQLNDLMKVSGTGMQLSSAHVGSMGGIMAMRKGETHIAPIHLLDEATGVYNTSFVRRYLRDKTYYLLKGIQRMQGLYVPAGNPQGITGIADIARKSLVFANRQKGSGTRTLLDFELKKDKLESKDIIGYEREFTTHTNVALAVLSGNADAGLGIESAARLMGLDFIPLSLEDYDFLISEAGLQDPGVKVLMDILESNDFRYRLGKLGGYQLNEFTLEEVGGEPVA